ncbi:glycerate 2-kinase [Acidiplasma sp.]|uniref:glycerate 2-kinase n=1 Tax=Acidiplasma sp. TaxID=1872114 RepID=UPI0025863BE4|nr:glycerate 2-kinase [Acidiplasma sp.]
MAVNNINDISFNDRRKFAVKLIDDMLQTLTPENAINNVFNVNINMYKNVYLIGFGKASFRMYSGIRPKIINKLRYAGIIVPEDEIIGHNFTELRIYRGTHPYVSNASVNSSIELLRPLKNLNEDDLVIVLISGGGSSLFEIPEDNVSVDDIMEISKEIMNSGGNIYDLNIIRLGLSSVKGGKLASYLYPAHVKSYIISDVFYDDLGIIASGPLVREDYSDDVQKISEKYVKNPGLRDFINKNYRKNSLDMKYYERIENIIILKNKDFVDYLYKNLDSNSVSLGSNINGDVNDVSNYLINILRNIYSVKRSGFWFVCGGETTVNVKGNGIGGRNEELCMKMLKLYNNDEQFLFLSIGTDGIDGLSPAAGGIVDNFTKIENIDDYLKNNDSYNALKPGNIIMTGRTGNNVSDIILGYYNKFNNF